MAKELTRETKSAWEVYGGKAHSATLKTMVANYLDFISQCKTERETVAYAVTMLNNAGFSAKRNITGFYLTHHNKTLFAVRKGTAPLSAGIHLIGAHADSPRLDLKQNPLQEQANIGQAKTHYYGGIRKYQWLARPLAIHGVVVKADGEVVNVVLGEDPKDPVFTIADLLPHLAAKQAGQTLADAFEGEKLNIVIGHRPMEKLGEKSGEKASAKDGKKDQAGKEPVKARLLSLLNKKYGMVEEDFCSAELEVVPAGPARLVGLDGALIGGYGQDDRICVFAALQAFLNSKDKPAHTQVLMLWDKEEIGSEGSTGAKSSFFQYCLGDLLAQWEPGTPLSTVLLNSRAISGDVHGAVDPDWQELHEKLNAAYIGHGPCFCKFTGHRGKYEANDAHAEYVGWIRRVMNRNNIPWQMAELGKVDGGGGGTVAMHLARLGMNIIDFGPALLSMHSPFELSSTVDLYATIKAYEAFLNASADS